MAHWHTFCFPNTFILGIGRLFVDFCGPYCTFWFLFGLAHGRYLLQYKVCELRMYVHLLTTMHLSLPVSLHAEVNVKLPAPLHGAMPANFTVPAPVPGVVAAKAPVLHHMGCTSARNGGCESACGIVCTGASSCRLESHCNIACTTNRVCGCESACTIYLYGQLWL